MESPVIRPFTADDTAWLVQAHADHYARAEGFDDTFGPLVAGIVAAFQADHDPQREAGWIADNGTQIGSIFVVRVSDEVAKLRLFYVDPAARGTGLAQALLDRCLGFARDAGYRRMTLWTHASHIAAGRIYARNGFTRVAAEPVHSFGVDLIAQTWDIDL